MALRVVDLDNPNASPEEQEEFMSFLDDLIDESIQGIQSEPDEDSWDDEPQEEVSDEEFVIPESAKDLIGQEILIGDEIKYTSDITRSSYSSIHSGVITVGEVMDIVITTGGAILKVKISRGAYTPASDGLVHIGSKLVARMPRVEARPDRNHSIEIFREPEEGLFNPDEI